MKKKYFKYLRQINYLLKYYSLIQILIDIKNKRKILKFTLYLLNCIIRSLDKSLDSAFRLLFTKSNMLTSWSNVNFVSILACLSNILDKQAITYFVQFFNSIIGRKSSCHAENFNYFSISHIMKYLVKTLSGYYRFSRNWKSYLLHFLHNQ